MNCANHPDITSVAYCRTCGKALCANCTRTVRGVIYCENCLAERLEGVQPPATAYQPFVQPSGAVPPQPGGGPNPTVAGILAGFFPFGVGAVYCGQYAKALAHLLIFVGLIWGADHGGGFTPLFGMGIAFFYVYQIIDAVRSAKAIQLGQPAPDPFGLGRALGVTDSERMDASKIPTASIVLIGLGVLFLLNTTGIFSLDFHRIWPIFLIALGGWLLAVRLGYVGHNRAYDCGRCRTRGLMGPAILITVGVLSLLDSVTPVGWDRTWPLLLVVIGVVKFLHNGASTEGHVGPPDDQDRQVPPTGISAGQIQPPPTSEVHNG